MNKNNYTYKKLGEVCDKASSNIVLNKIENNIGKYPLYGASGLVKKIDFYQQDQPYIGVVKDGSGVGRVDIYPAFSSLVGTLQYIMPHKDCLLDYLKYVMQSLNLSSFVTGAAIPHIYFKDYCNLLVPVPPLATQRKIVAELDCLNSIIAKKRLQLQDYDRLAQALFHQTFGDPVDNDMGWEVKKLGEVCESVNYGTSSPSNENGKYKYIRMNNITYSGELDLHDLKYIDVADKDYEKYVVRKGDILFNRTNSKELVGKTTFFNEKEEMIIAGYIIRVRLMNNILPVFVARYMNTAYIKTYLRELCKSIIGQANINAKELQNILIYLPPIALQQQFAAKIEAIEAQKARIRQSITEVQTLLNYTMDKYFG